MKRHVASSWIAVAVALALASTGWALDPRVVGTWQFTEDGETSQITFNANGQATVDGEAMGFSADNGAMKLRPATVPGLELDARYEITGNQLKLVMFEEETVYTRAGGAAAEQPPAASSAPPPAPPRRLPNSGSTAGSAPTGNPLAKQGGGNPLAKKAASAWSGRWSGEGVILEIDGSDNALTGGLVVEGNLMPTTATAAGDQLKGTFTVDGTAYAYRATRNGERIVLESDGASYTLHRVPGAMETAPRGIGTIPTVIDSPPRSAGNATTRAGSGSTVGAATLSAPGEGFELAPAGGFFEMQAQGQVRLLGSNSTPGLMLLLSNPSMTAADIEQGASMGYQDESMQLSPTSSPAPITVDGGSGKMVSVQGIADGQQVVGVLAGIARPGGGGIVLTALTTQESWPQLQPAAEQTIRSVRLFEPQITARLQQARAALAGHSLVIAFNNSTVSQNSDGYYTGSAVNSFRAWHCCANGQGRYEGARSSSFQGGGMIGSSEGSAGPADGAWSLSESGDGFVLTFQFNDGSSESWTLTLDDSENVYVDGQRAKVTTDSICQ